MAAKRHKRIQDLFEFFCAFLWPFPTRKERVSRETQIDIDIYRLASPDFRSNFLTIIAIIAIIDRRAQQFLSR
jgi:hypothetical protein